jgi:hypothetical protein
MTTNSDFDRHAAAFIADGPTELADRVLDAALVEVHLTRQRRGLTAPWRLPRMHGMFRLATAAIAVAVAVFGSAYIVGYRPSLGPAAPPTATPAAVASLDSCGHELVRGLLLTAGCTYRTSDMAPALSITSDGTWLDSFQTRDALDFIANTGPALNTTVRIRPLRGVLADACAYGSGERLASTPKTAQAYLDWLGAFIVEPTRALPAEAFGLRGWRFDLGAGGKETFDPEDPCAFVSLSEPAVGSPTGLAETVAIARNEVVRVYVLDVNGGVLLAMLWTGETPASEVAGEAFLAGIAAAP